MAGINEPDLYERGRHCGTIKDVKLFRLLDASPWVPGEDELKAFRKALGETYTILYAVADPHLASGGLSHAWMVWIWIRVQVDGQEYVGLMRFGRATTFSETDGYIFLTGHDHPALQFEKPVPEFEADPERKVLLPKRLRDSPGVITTMPRVKTNERSH